MKPGILPLVKRSSFGMDSVADAAKATRQIGSAQAHRIFSVVGAKKRYPILSFKDPEFQNAMYVGPGSSDSALKQFTKGVDNMTPARMNNLKETGFIAHGPGFSNPGFMAHEAGHAVIEEEGGLPAFLQKHRDGIAAAGIFGGLGAGYMAAQKVNPWVGAALGGAITALGQVPIILNERAATRYATNYMDQSRMSEQSKAKNLNALRKGMNSYLLNGAVVTALSAASGAMLSVK